MAAAHIWTTCGERFGVLRPSRCRSFRIQASREPIPLPKLVTTGVVQLPDAGSLASEELPFGVAATQGPRPTMEDEAVVFPEGKCGFLYASASGLVGCPRSEAKRKLIVVLDGHDGLESVQWLSEHLFEIFSDVLDESLYDGSCSIDQADQDSGLCCPVELSPTLKQSFHAADRQLLEKLESMPSVDGKDKSAESISVGQVAERRGR